MVSLLALVALASFPAVFAQLTINTPPSVTQCQPTKLSWSGGSAPFFLAILPAGQPSAAPLETLPNQNGNDFTWQVDLATGSTFTISLKDNTGNQAFSDIVTVQGSGDSSCVGKGGASGAAAPTSAGASSGAAPSGTAQSTTPGASSPAASSAGASSRPSSAATSASGSTRSSATSGSAASATPSNAALNTKGNALAMAGVMGLVGAVLF